MLTVAMLQFIGIKIPCKFPLWHSWCGAKQNRKRKKKNFKGVGIGIRNIWKQMSGWCLTGKEIKRNVKVLFNIIRSPGMEFIKVVTLRILLTYENVPTSQSW